MFSSLFVNMPVASVEKSVEFFEKLGFGFDPRFTSEQSACLIVTDNVKVMLSNRDRFVQLVERPIADQATSEMVLSFECASPEMVSELAQKAFELGARKISEREENEFMVSWGFEDLDGHLWDLFWFRS